MESDKTCILSQIKKMRGNFSPSPSPLLIKGGTFCQSSSPVKGPLPIKLSFNKAEKNQNVVEKPNMSDDVLSDDEALESEMLHVEIPELKGGKMSEESAGEEGKDEKADADGEAREG